MRNTEIGKYYRMWERRYRPFKDNDFVAVTFSPDYFVKLKCELERAGYEVTIEDASDPGDVWYCSEPTGHFHVNNALKGESLFFQDYKNTVLKKAPN